MRFPFHIRAGLARKGARVDGINVSRWLYLRLEWVGWR
jgi:hypothetical protein